MIVFPWQTKQWQQIQQSYQQDRLPHALLFSGMAGIGKKQFAHTFAHSLLCRHPAAHGGACEACRSCHLRRAHSHPDLLIVEPEESGQMIKIEQIRSVIEFVNETPQQGGYRIIIINPANAMNLNSANALLKSLEEPTPRCLFILISDKSLRLLPTIKSRCQEILFSKPEKTMALQWLQEQKKEGGENTELLLSLAHGAPLKALELLENNFLTLRQDLYQGMYSLSQHQINPLQFASQWLDTNLLTLLNLLQDWLRDLMRFKLTKGEGELVNHDFREIYLLLSQQLSMKDLLRYIDCIKKKYAEALASLNLNRLLVLEEIFIQWVRICFSSTRTVI